MPRPPRIYPDGIPQHVYNRGNQRQRIFRDRVDYQKFLDATEKAASSTTVRVNCVCLMPNHYHLLVTPAVGADISTFVDLVMNEHIQHLQARHGLVGTGHVYQGRHKNVPILSERHFYVAARYVESNARAAGLVDRSEEWPWSSACTTGPCARVVVEWPVARPDRWIELANDVPSDRLLKEIFDTAKKARRDGAWALRTATLVSR
jgi:REP-associated tyrosine transposase